MSANTKDMTLGKPAGLLLSFAVPLMIGNIFQQLYTVVDTMIVGQFVGVEALAALGAAEWIHWMVFGIVTGAAQGFSILTAQKFGADDGEGLRKSVTMSALLSGITAIVSTVVSVLFCKPVLRFLNTPENVFDNAVTYLVIMFGGMIVVAGYNTFASVLRAMGNSKAPLIAMIIAALLNVILDLVFVINFKWGVGGAAFATIIAQLFACLFCFGVMRKIPVLTFNENDWNPNKQVILQLIKLGMPIAFQNVIISIGGMTVQFVINGFGFLFIAGFTATNKLYGLLEVAATSYGFSMATFTGQNLGAQKYGRIRSGMRVGALMAVMTALIITAAMLLFGRQILLLFISGESGTIQAVMNIAYKYLVIMSIALFILYLLHTYRSALQGMGDALTPMLSGIVEMIMRTAVVLLLPLAIGEEGVYYAEVAAWLGAAILLILVYYIRVNRLPQD